MNPAVKRTHGAWPAGGGITLAIALSMLLVLAAGCGESRRSATPGKQRPDTSAQWSDELFSNAVNNLNRLEEFDASEVRNQIMRRMRSVDSTGQLPQAQQADPLAATWPEPEMLEQIVSRLDQWVKVQNPPSDWKLDPLAVTLQASLAELPMTRNLDKMRLTSYDGFTLLEAVWLRDASNWARGNKTDDLEYARKLFDWTIRNVQFEAESPDRIPQVPWESLLLGRGTAMERAWIFMLLLRQQGIDAGLVELPVVSQSLLTLEKGPGLEGVSSEGPGRWNVPWCVAVLVEKKLYLFDPRLGLPIPAPDGVRVEGAGQLDIRPATLEQVVTDRAMLDRLDLDAQHPYWAKSADFKQLVVAVEGSPIYLSKRGKLLESRLVGKQKMVLNTDATAQGKRLGEVAHAAKVRLWNLPYQTLHTRSQLGTGGICRRLDVMWPLVALESTPLFKGRVLHLKGRFLDSEGAIQCYQAARPTNQTLVEEHQRRMAEFEKSVPEHVRRLPPDQQSGVVGRMAQQAQLVIRFEMRPYLRGKLDASYWLGLIAFEQGNYASAIDYFAKRTLEASPDGPWTLGAQYNLARAREAMGPPQKAVEQYQAGVVSYSYYGNLLRARWLKQAASAGDKRAGESKK